MTYILKEGLPYILWKLFESNQNPFDLREPWMCKKARDFLKNNINKDFEVFEYGGGGSTLYFSDNCKSVETIEVNEQWKQKIKDSLKKNNVTFVETMPNKKYDLILIDGEEDRIKFFENAKKHLKQKGIIVFDNIDRYNFDKKNIIIFSGWSKNNAGKTYTGVYQV